MKKFGKEIYELNGKPSMRMLIPFGLQHVLAMFASNVAPILIVASAAGLSPELTRIMIQAAMMTSGIATLLNVYGFKIGKYQVGARLPLMMGVSFAFVGVASQVGGQFGFGAVVGAAMLAAVLELIMGVFYKQIKRVFNPIVTGTLLVALGLYLIGVGANYFLGGFKFKPELGKAIIDPTGTDILVATIVLLVVLGVRIYGHGLLKSSAVLIGIVVGYVISIPLGLVNFGSISEIPFVSFGQFVPFAVAKPTLVVSAIIPFAIVYFASAVETIGDIKGVAMGGLQREASDEEISGGLIADSLGSVFSSMFNALPNTSFGQNVGIVTSTKVISKHVLGFGAGFLVLASLFPQFSEIVRIVPSPVIGGALITVFAIITANGLKMLSIAGASDNNLFIIATAFAIGLGLGGRMDLINAVADIPVVGFLVKALFSTTITTTTIVAILGCYTIKPDWSKGSYKPDHEEIVNEYLNEA